MRRRKRRFGCWSKKWGGCGWRKKDERTWTYKYGLFLLIHIMVDSNYVRGGVVKVENRVSARIYIKAIKK